MTLWLQFGLQDPLLFGLSLGLEPLVTLFCELQFAA